MPPTKPPVRRRRRPRRGTLERPVNGRLYRAGLMVAVIPLLLVAFTIASPAALLKPTLPEAFDTAAASALSTSLATGYPDRVPGTPGAGDGKPYGGATAWFVQQLRPYGLALSASTWTADVPGLGRVPLTNLSAVAAGQSPEAIVVMAHRDDLGIAQGANDNASGTAVLVELARAYAEPRGIARGSVQSPHTLIFLSTDGGAYGALGVAHFLATSRYRRHIAAVLNLDALAGPGAPRLEIGGDRARSPSPTLLATATARISEQIGDAPARDSLFDQLIDLGFPLTLYEQGPFLAAGIPAVTLTTGGDRPPSAFGDNANLLKTRRLGQLGLAAQELLGSLDQDVELAPATASFLWTGARTIRGWAVELLLIGLLVPVAIAVVDLYALGRRNDVALGPAVRALCSRLGFWLFVAAVFTCFRLLGAFPGGPPRPPNPVNPVIDHWPVAALLALALLALGGWCLARQRLVVRRPVTAAEQFAGYLVALVTLLLAALLVAATNPFALVFVLPVVHVWLWLPQIRIARAPVRLALFVLGLAGPGLVLGSLALRLKLGFAAPWYLLELVANGYIGPLAVLITLAGTAAAAQLAAAAAGRYAPYPPMRERGPRGPIRELVRSTAVLGRRLRAAARARQALDPYRAR